MGKLKNYEFQGYDDYLVHDYVRDSRYSQRAGRGNNRRASFSTHRLGGWVKEASVRFCMFVVFVMVCGVLIAATTPAKAQQGPYIVSPDGTYLGNLNNNPLDANSVSNPLGRYGSPLSADSINNPLGKYGSPLSPYSPNNSLNQGINPSPSEGPLMNGLRVWGKRF